MGGEEAGSDNGLDLFFLTVRRGTDFWSRRDFREYLVDKEPATQMMCSSALSCCDKTLKKASLDKGRLISAHGSRGFSP